MAYRPLGLVRDMLAGMGLEVTYAYEDLVFVSHNAFLLQFEDEGEIVGLRVNSQCPAGEVDSLVASAVRAGADVGLAVVMRGRYETTSNGRDDSFSLRFL